MEKTVNARSELTPGCHAVRLVAWNVYNATAIGLFVLLLFAVVYDRIGRIQKYLKRLVALAEQKEIDDARRHQDALAIAKELFRRLDQPVVKPPPPPQHGGLPVGRL